MKKKERVNEITTITKAKKNRLHQNQTTKRSKMQLFCKRGVFVIRIYIHIQFELIRIAYET